MDQYDEQRSGGAGHVDPGLSLACHAVSEMAVHAEALARLVRIHVESPIPTSSEDYNSNDNDNDVCTMIILAAVSPAIDELFAVRYSGVLRRGLIDDALGGHILRFLGYALDIVHVDESIRQRTLACAARLMALPTSDWKEVATKLSSQHRNDDWVANLGRCLIAMDQAANDDAYWQSTEQETLTHVFESVKVMHQVASSSTVIFTADGKELLRSLLGRLGRVLAASQQRMTPKRCATCGADQSQLAPRKLLLCTGCGATWYCGQECQRRDWLADHKRTCKLLKKN
jgi:MYND finger